MLRRGDFINTVLPLYMCAYNGCIAFPRYVKAVRRMNIANQAMPPHSLWYQFLPYNQEQCRSLTGRQSKFNQLGQSSVLQDVQGEGRLIRAYARCQTDLGKTLTIFGIDNNGQPLQTQNADGTWSFGVKLTLQAPFASTSTYVRTITRVLRDATQCIVDVYAYNAATNLLEDIAHYEPNETNPVYTRYGLDMGPCVPTCGTSTGSCSSQTGALALVKVRHVDAAAPTDIIFLDNVDALKQMFLSIKAEVAGDRAGARGFEADAIGILNAEIRDNQPEEQFDATPNTLGPNVWPNQMF